MGDTVAGSPRGASERPAGLYLLTSAGLAFLVLGTALYVSGASRATGVVLAAMGGASLVAAAAVRVRGAWPARVWLIAVSVLLVLVALYGLALWIYALRTHNTEV